MTEKVLQAFGTSPRSSSGDSDSCQSSALDEQENFASLVEALNSGVEPHKDDQVAAALEASGMLATLAKAVNAQSFGETEAPASSKSGIDLLQKNIGNQLLNQRDSQQERADRISDNDLFGGAKKKHSRGQSGFWDAQFEARDAEV